MLEASYHSAGLELTLPGTVATVYSLEPGQELPAWLRAAPREVLISWHFPTACGQASRLAGSHSQRRPSVKWCRCWLLQVGIESLGWKQSNL